MEFEWDENKNKSNEEKHGLNFNQAKEVFKDPDKFLAASKSDSGEERIIIVGRIVKFIATVVYTLRDTAVRIISARAASKQERKMYHENQEKK